MTSESDWVLHFDNRKPIPEVVASQLADLIETGRLPRGESLPNENELARRFSVSRSSVRTALQSLQHRGLVEVTRGRGWSTTSRPAAHVEPAQAGHPAVAGRDGATVVVDVAAYRLALVFEVRMALESAASSVAAIVSSVIDLSVIEDAHLAHLKADPGNPDEMLRTDEAFHDAIFAVADDATLAEAYMPIRDAVRDFRRLCFQQDSEGAAHSSLGHGMVLDALKKHDSAGAKQAMTAHLLMFSSRLGPALPLALSSQ